MARDFDRIASLRNALSEAGLDALICALPSNVRLISGYWPVIAASLAVITRDGYVSIVAPEDERELAEQGWADELSLFKPGSLTEIKSLAQAVRGRLAEAAGILARGARIGIEEAVFEPTAYVGQYHYRGMFRELLSQVLPAAHLKPAGNLLASLRAVLTPAEITRLKKACQMVDAAFQQGRAGLSAGMTEMEAAANFCRGVSTSDFGWDVATRAGGYAFCMSGANSAKAYAAFQRSTSREILPGDFALVHCNSYMDGFWTDVTRTFCLGDPDERQHEIYEAIFSARQAALRMIRPGVKAGEVDQAARRILEERDLGEHFKHPLGHGVGFAVLDCYARPCIHPASKDILQPGMVFNIEPAAYFEGYGGVRHCDMVAVTSQGAELLTPSLCRMEDLVVASREEVRVSAG